MDEINKLFIVNVQDTVLQMTSYLVRASNVDHAKALIGQGMYMEEMKSEIVDTLDTKITAAEEINPDAEGQNHK